MPHAGCDRESDGTDGCTLGDIAADSTKTFDIVVAVASSVTGGSRTVTFASTSDTKLRETHNDSASTTLTVGAQASLAVTLTALPASVVAGETIAYDVTITNNGVCARGDVNHCVHVRSLIAGPSDARAVSIDVSFSHTASVASNTCGSSTLAKDAVRNCAITVAVPVSAGGFTLMATATASSVTTLSPASPADSGWSRACNLLPHRSAQTTLA